jgi:NADPH-dependent 2,4-dienoyl-CoA reductase/sulfur reductase-like enzyme
MAPKRVLVVGGGPAGMEAARVAAVRGHQVILCEQESRLGGALNIATVPPGKDKLSWIAEYFDHELSRLGVDLRLGETMDGEKVRALRPDAVILATGARADPPNIPGVDRPNVLLAQELLAHQMRFTGQRIVVIGGGMLGLETAEYLATQGNAVTVLKRYETIGRTIEPLYLGYLLRQLKECDVEIVTCVVTEAISADGVLVRDREGQERMMPTDWVVLARGTEAANRLVQEIEALDPVIIGDAAQPRRIIDAIAEGFRAAQSV